MKRGIVWAALSIDEFGSIGRKAHLVPTHGSAGRYKANVALCGVRTDNWRSWRRTERKPKCAECQSRVTS